METTVELDRFAAIKQAQHDRAIAEDARNQAVLDAENAAEAAFALGLDRILRMLGILSEVDEPMTTNCLLEGAFTFSLVKASRSSYVYLEIEHLLDDEHSDAYERLMYSDSPRLTRIVNTDGLLDHEPKAGQLNDFRARVGDSLNQLRSDYQRLCERMAEKAAADARPPVVVIEYRGGHMGKDGISEAEAFAGRAAELVKAGYKPSGYTSASESSGYGDQIMRVSALFILGDD